MERYNELRADFISAAAAFSEAKRKDERDAHMNKDFVANRAMAAAYADQILDEYLDLRDLETQATPLEPAKSA